MDGSNIVCVGYVGLPEPGFKFVADESRPAVWKLDSSGNVVSEEFPPIEGLGQLAKIRKVGDQSQLSFILTNTISGCWQWVHRLQHRLGNSGRC